MKSLSKSAILFTFISGLSAGTAQEARIEVQADCVLHPVSRHLTGACIEDVNHEVYGGIDSQMIFGESFAEPPPQPPLVGFSVFGGKWTIEKDGSIQVLGSDGAKIVCDGPAFSEGEASVDVWLTESAGGNGGFILKVSDPAKGADLFNGYEVSLERPGILVLGRHRCPLQGADHLSFKPDQVATVQKVKLDPVLAHGRVQLHRQRDRTKDEVSVPDCVSVRQLPSYS